MTILQNTVVMIYPIIIMTTAPYEEEEGIRLESGSVTLNIGAL